MNLHAREWSHIILDPKMYAPHQNENRPQAENGLSEDENKQQEQLLQNAPLLVDCTFLISGLFYVT
jgi:hypothetical protein